MSIDKLEKQLTKEVQKIEKEDSEGDITQLKQDAWEDDETELELEHIQNKALQREMQELQQALASEVGIHTSRYPSGEKNQENTQNLRHSEYKSKNDLNSESEKLPKKLRKTKENELQGRLPVWVGIVVGLVMVLLTVGIVTFANSIGKTALTGIGLMEKEEKVTTVVTKELTLVPTGITVTPTQELKITVTPTPEPEEPKDEVYYVLLLGIDCVESQDSADAIMVAGVNKTDHSYQLIQFMRNLYVDIPGYGKEKLAEAYRYGGGMLLAETIRVNFELPIMGYVSSDFHGFTSILNMMGPITVNLTKEEADYLNHTNYIESREYRNVQSGKQKLNGEQTMGYLRISAVPDAYQATNDFGRTNRAARVINQLSDRAKSMSFGDLLMTMNEALGHIRTNLTKDQFRKLLEMVSEMGITRPETLRIPIRKHFTKDQVNQEMVYIPDWDITKEQIRTLVFGENKKE